MKGFFPWRADGDAAFGDVNPGAFDGLAVTVDEGLPRPVVQPDRGRAAVAP